VTEMTPTVFYFLEEKRKMAREEHSEN